jgi:hypothetical protein
MNKPRKQSGQPVRWQAYLLRGKGAYLGSVYARDEGEAIKAAIRRFDVLMRDRFRISVRRE